MGSHHLETLIINGPAATIHHLLRLLTCHFPEVSIRQPDPLTLLVLPSGSKLGFETQRLHAAVLTMAESLARDHLHTAVVRAVLWSERDSGDSARLTANVEASRQRFGAARMLSFVMVPDENTILPGFSAPVDIGNAFYFAWSADEHPELHHLTRVWWAPLS